MKFRYKGGYRICGKMIGPIELNDISIFTNNKNADFLNKKILNAFSVEITNSPNSNKSANEKEYFDTVIENSIDFISSQNNFIQTLSNNIYNITKYSNLLILKDYTIFYQWNYGVDCFGKKMVTAGFRNNGDGGLNRCFASHPNLTIPKREDIR